MVIVTIERWGGWAMVVRASGSIVVVVMVWWWWWNVDGKGRGSGVCVVVV